MKYVAICLGVSLLAGCATGTVRMVGDTKTYENGSCKITVFQTEAEAKEFGIQREVCVVEGNSIPSFDHSLDTAIEKSMRRLCSCGVDTAFIRSSHQAAELGIRGATFVTLVGFK
jgi:hypothetical protein